MDIATGAIVRYKDGSIAGYREPGGYKDLIVIDAPARADAQRFAQDHGITLITPTYAPHILNRGWDGRMYLAMLEVGIVAFYLPDLVRPDAPVLRLGTFVHLVDEDAIPQHCFQQEERIQVLTHFDQ